MSTLPSPSPCVRLLTPPRAPSIADRVARAFPPAACIRGYFYFDRKRVALAIPSESRVDATVKGKRTQQVSVQVAGAHLGTRCTCAAQTLGPASCRHVWAVLLEIDRIGALEVLRGSRARLPLTAIDAEPKGAEAEPPKKAPKKAKAPAKPPRRKRA
ncbi:MAG: hypothetical protein KF819_00730 [Labilithrix sp.]|nr:hypothetical protein [Labilithrix sp.]